MMKKKLKTLIITGFLGAGKTTLINTILERFEHKKIAIIENEFSELGIDSNLIKGKKDNVIELTNGCICCTLSGELEGALGEIIKEDPQYDYLIVETTGVADPGPIVDSFFSNPQLSEKFEIDSVITLIDSEHFFSQINRTYEVKKQVAFGDIILLNKIDLVNQEQLIKIKNKITSINSQAQILESSFSQVDVDFFNLESFNMKKVDSLQDSLTTMSFSLTSPTTSLQTKKHLNEIESVGIEFEDPISLPKFDYFMRMLLEHKSDDLYRMKGIVNIEGSRQPIIFQGVHSSLDFFPGRPWEDKDHKTSKFVFIGKNLDKKELEYSLKELIAQPE